ncbi:hypothetical protein N7532_008417 [Penicillium argentinense]|uniref:Uncharacterized protein n=1 Tax=Penicillium argentinense TaxID=1131581 RepID=A0A9W9EX98_9EURO|nr:uncharacterized protein N7532_008417 [Penicillium argentinense]KAJ5089733.1 hypothetical protein N7532_008417 [Penicillium argentinense]
MAVQLASVMTDSTEIQRDDVLVVIFLFGLYEMFTSSSRDGSWITHMQGTQSVIEHQDSTRLADDSNYLSILCTHLVVYYLTENKDPPPHLDRWIQQIPFENDLKKHLVRLMSEASRLCMRLRQRCALKGATDHADLSVLDDSLALDMKLEAWATQLPPAWSYIAQTSLSHSKRPKWSKQLFSGPGAPEKMVSYFTSLSASNWNLCRATRIRLNLTLLKFLDKRPFLSPHIPELRARTIEILLNLTNEVAHTLAYLFNLSPDGSSDLASPSEIPTIWAYMVMWPTFTSYFCLQQKLVKEKDTLQRGVWFRKVLNFLSESAGIAKVRILVQETTT